MYSSIVDCGKSFWENWLLLWSWRVLAGKKLGFKYEDVLTNCRRSQYIVALVALLIAGCFDTSRQLMITAIQREGLLILLMEIITYCLLGYFIGIKRLPANYVSFVIIRLFVTLEKQYKPQARDFQIKVLGQSRHQGFWSELSYKPEPGHVPVETIVRHGALSAFGLLALWVISKVSKFDLSNHVRTALVCNTISTSTAALLLLTSFSFESFPKFIPKHRQYCEVWVMMSTTILFFNITFLYQRLWKLFGGKLKPSQCMRLHWESICFMTSLYVMLRYIPVIHKGFSTRNLLGDIMKNSVLKLLPQPVFNFGSNLGTHLYNLSESIVNAQPRLFYEDQYQ